MTSTTCSSKPLRSFFFLYRWFLRRSLGLTLLLALIDFIALPLVGIFYDNIMPYTAVGFSLQASLGASLLFVLVFTCINFSYLHNKRIGDLMLAFPARRTDTLLAAMASTFTSVILPFAFNLLLASVFCPVLSAEEYIMYGSDFQQVNSLVHHSTFFGQSFGIACLLLFACAVFSSLIAVCCGTTFDTVISIVVINAAYPALLFLANDITTYFIPGYYAEISQNLPLLTACSPYLALFAPLADFLGRKSFSLLWFLLWWAFISLVLLGLTLLLHQRRKSEAAETAFAFRAPSAIIRVLVSFTAGLGFGFFLIFQRGIRLSNLIIGLFLGISAVFLILEVIYSRGFKQLKKAIPYYVTTLLLSGLFTLCLSTGFFGTFYWIPNVQDVNHVTIEYQNYYPIPKTSYNITEEWAVGNGQTYPMSVTQYPSLSQPENIQTVTELHAAAHSSLQKSDRYGAYNRLTRRTLRLSYTMKDGTVIKRIYNIPQTDTLYSKDFGLDFLLKLSDSEEFKRGANGIFHTQENQTVYACGRIFTPPSDYYGVPSFYYNTEDYQNLSACSKKLAAALQQDILEDSVQKQRKWYFSTGGEYPVSLHTSCLLLGFSEDPLPSNNKHNLPELDAYIIPPYYEHTWKVLKDNGLYIDTEVTP